MDKRLGFWRWVRRLVQGWSHRALRRMCCNQAVSAAEGDCTHSLSSDGIDGPCGTISPTRASPRRGQSGEHACRGLSLTAEVPLLGHQPSDLTVFFFLFPHSFLVPLLPASTSVLQSSALGLLSWLAWQTHCSFLVFFFLTFQLLLSFFFITSSLYKWYVLLIEK